MCLMACSCHLQNNSDRQEISCVDSVFLVGDVRRLYLSDGDNPTSGHIRYYEENGKSFLIQGNENQNHTEMSPRTFSSVQLFSRVQLFVTPWTAARRASLSITSCWSLLKLISIESVMLSNHLILCHPLLLLPSVFSKTRVFSNESVLRIRWPKYWSFRLSISPSSE